MAVGPLLLCRHKPADRAVRNYSIAGGDLVWESRLHSDWVTCAAFSDDDRFVATGSRDFTVKILDAAE